jgi:adenylylsulfate kinase
MIRSDQAEIHPEFGRMLGREAKERLLGQRGHVVWLFGLSGSGKSTLAHGLERALHGDGRFTALLDGDNLRAGLNAGLGFSDADRAENIRRAAELAKLLAANGVVVVASFICPGRALREQARAIIGAGDLSLVHVRASFAECARRDVKGLYAKAAAGGLAQFTGRDSAFEEPAAGEVALVIDTEGEPPDESIRLLLDFTRPKVALP